MYIKKENYDFSKDPKMYGIQLKIKKGQLKVQNNSCLCSNTLNMATKAICPQFVYLIIASLLPPQKKTQPTKTQSYSLL